MAQELDQYIQKELEVHCLMAQVQRLRREMNVLREQAIPYLKNECGNSKLIDKSTLVLPAKDEDKTKSKGEPSPYFRYHVRMWRPSLPVKWDFLKAQLEQWLPKRFPEDKEAFIKGEMILKDIWHVKTEMEKARSMYIISRVDAKTDKPKRPKRDLTNPYPRTRRTKRTKALDLSEDVSSFSNTSLEFSSLEDRASAENLPDDEEQLEEGEGEEGEAEQWDKPGGASTSLEETYDEDEEDI